MRAGEDRVRLQGVVLARARIEIGVRHLGIGREVAEGARAHEAHIPFLIARHPRSVGADRRPVGDVRGLRRGALQEASDGGRHLVVRRADIGERGRDISGNRVRDARAEHHAIRIRREPAVALRRRRRRPADAVHPVAGIDMVIRRDGRGRDREQRVDHVVAPPALRPGGEGGRAVFADVDRRFLLVRLVEQDAVAAPIGPHRHAVIVELLLAAGELPGRDAVAAQLVEQRDVDLLAVRLEVHHPLDDVVRARARIGIESAVAKE